MCLCKTFSIRCVEMVEIWLLRLPRNEQFYPRAPLVTIEDSVVGDLYIELVATFDLKCHMCSKIVVEEVIYVAHIDENGDGLLFKKSSNFLRLWVGVTGQRMHCIVGRLGLSSMASSSGLRLSFDEGAEGFSMAGWGATLVLRASWLSHSSWILAKEITAIRVGRTSKEPSIPCSLGGRTLVVKGAKKVENVEANSKYYDKT
ncbi:hypothetical protein B296_00000295 [Ensete ventricosum]|uniref:Uncharacterized protein n=1 Tax=Ensete ventricosum TaxID=4639 RepID=A0A427BB60_ENSVE|nr:hypothetical protein B296_00000295 [Ensete ventricosum]